MRLFKIVYIIFIIFVGLVAVLLVASIFPTFGGHRLMVVQSGSMEPAIKTGSLVIAKPVPDYKIGDIITFGSPAKTPITHRIFEIKNQAGQLVYLTKGDANNAPDAREISQREIVGRVIFTIPYIGYGVHAAKKPIGFLLIILIPAAIIIGDEAKKIWQERARIKNKKNDARIK